MRHEPAADKELKKGSAELLVLSLVEARARHGYEIGKLIDERSGGAVRYNVASLYPLLYRLEKRGWIKGQWIEKAGQRRRRYYRLTPVGRTVLDRQRRGWKAFVAAINRITGLENACPGLGPRVRSAPGGDRRPADAARRDHRRTRAAPRRCRPRHARPPRCRAPHS